MGGFHAGLCPPLSASDSEQNVQSDFRSRWLLLYLQAQGLQESDQTHNTHCSGVGTCSAEADPCCHGRGCRGRVEPVSFSPGTKCNVCINKSVAMTVCGVADEVHTIWKVISPSGWKGTSSISMLCSASSRLRLGQ